MHDFRETIECFMQSARDNLQRDGALHPCLLLVRPERVEAVPITLPKELWPTLPLALIEAFPDYLGIFTINEAWQKVNPSDLSRPASSYEDRTEVIIVEGKARDGEVGILMQPFDRDATGKPIFPLPAHWHNDQYISRTFSLL